MYFQALKYKGRNFLDLNNNNNQHIYPTYAKDGAWLKYFSLSNMMCIYITRLITNYTSIGEYRLRFFPKEPFGCLCRNYPIKMRRHILFECLQYKKFWNPKKEFLKNILTFLEFNSGVFYFQKDIT